MKNMIVADTGFFVALGNNGDRDHSRAIQIISTLSEPLITTYPVRVIKFSIFPYVYFLSKRVKYTNIASLEILCISCY
jgi:predicted nucleic acid-binding protein